MKSNLSISEQTPRCELVAGRDYYFENDLMILTAHFLRERGYCCENGCRHCPYPKSEATKLQHKVG